MTRQVIIPAENLSFLQLQDGDRLTGQVSRGQVKLVIESPESGSQERKGVGFADRWYGEFKNMGIGWSDDPRARAILNR